MRYNARENAFYIVDEIMECVKVYSPSGVLLKCLGERYFSSPAGLDFDSRGNLVLTDAEHCFVSLLTGEGQLLHKWYYRGVTDREIPIPYYAVFNEDDQVWWLDWHEECWISQWHM